MENPWQLNRPGYPVVWCEAEMHLFVAKLGAACRHEFQEVTRKAPEILDTVRSRNLVLG